MKKTVIYLCLLLLSGKVLSNEYENVRITGLIFNAKDDYIEFTIDKAPSKIISTKAYSDATQDYVVSMIIAAYRSHENVSYIRIKDFNANKNKKVLPLKSLKFADALYDLDIESLE